MGAVVNLPQDPLLDLPAYVGQRQASYRFYVTDVQSNAVLGELTPLRETATLTHDTSRTVKRQLQMNLGKHDSENIDPVSNRVSLFMEFPGPVQYPLGKYIFTLDDNDKYTSGPLGSVTLNDTMFAVDQEIRKGVNGFGKTPIVVINSVLEGLGVQSQVEAASFKLAESWGPGTTRGSILNAITTSCDYFSPWFDHNNVLRFIRTFDPGNRLPDIDFDYGNKVMRESIVRSTDVLTAPNVFVVISNVGQQNTNPNSGTIGDVRVDLPTVFSVPIVGSAQVPDSAPNSVARRGFEVVQSQTLQVTTQVQATSAAVGLMRRAAVTERYTMTTAPDPRHDSYNVIRWNGEQWLELSWSMELQEGGTMSHVLSKSLGR